MRQLVGLLFVFLLFSLPIPALAGELLSQSRTPTARVTSSDGSSTPCYATVYRLQGALYWREHDCIGIGSRFSSVGLPLIGPAVKSPREATHFKIRPNGTIVLH